MDYLSIDVGGTYIKYGLVNHSGSLTYRNKVKTPDNIDLFLQCLYKIINQYKKFIKGIGVSIPGKVDIDTGTIYHGGSLEYLHKLNLQNFIEKEFDIPCAISNDGNAAALAELWLGNLKDIDNGIVIVLGTGIGSGIVLDGEIYYGNNFQSGELSFCGDYSSDMISYNKLVGIKGSAVNFVKKCSNIMKLRTEDDGVEVFKKLVGNKSNELEECFIEYCSSIASLIINIQVILDIEVVLIGGGISEQDYLIRGIIKQYDKKRKELPILMHTFNAIPIVACKYKSDANLLGAVYQLLLNIEKNADKRI